MRSELKYPVVIENKIPVVSKILEKLFLVFLIVAAVGYILHLPLFSTRTEMEKVAMLITYPRTLIIVFIISIAGLCFFYFLNVKIRSAIKGFLHFEADSIIVETKTHVTTIPIDSIADIKFYDPGAYYHILISKKLYIFISQRLLIKPLRYKA